MLLVFRSPSSGDFIMHQQHAFALLGLMGKSETAQGIISREEVAQLHAVLVSRLEQQPEPVLNEDQEISQNSTADASQAVGLKQRAWPLLEMLKKAALKQHDVTWGV